MVAGIFYLKKVPAPSFADKLLVRFLVFVVILEIVAIYAAIGYFSKYEYFSFIEHTQIKRNVWLYNIYIPVNAVFITYYFAIQLKRKNIVKKALIVSAFYILGAILDNWVSGNFFEVYSPFSQMGGCLLILTSVILYFFEMLRSDLILNMKKTLPFYIAVGVFFFQLCTTPIFLLSNYFSTSSGNLLFIELQINVVLFANIFMYSCFILGFIICSKKKKYS